MILGNPNQKYFISPSYVSVSRLKLGFLFSLFHRLFLSFFLQKMIQSHMPKYLNTNVTLSHCSTRSIILRSFLYILKKAISSIRWCLCSGFLLDIILDTPIILFDNCCEIHHLMKWISFHLCSQFSQISFSFISKNAVLRP